MDDGCVLDDCLSLLRTCALVTCMACAHWSDKAELNALWSAKHDKARTAHQAASPFKKVVAAWKAGTVLRLYGQGLHALFVAIVVMFHKYIVT